MNAPHPHIAAARRSQRGAALLLAMLIITLVATLSAAMVWQQWRATEVEAGERARSQAAWLLSGALDWARLILREDGRTTANVDHLGEPWAVPLAEARLSSFLAADANQNVDTGPDAFLSGSIVDAQSRYNLRNLLEDDKEQAAAELRVLQRLCDAIALPAETATRLAQGLRSAAAGEDGGDDGDQKTSNTSNSSTPLPLPPQRLSQLRWLGFDADTIRRLQPYADILPSRTPVNVNTAPAEVLMAAIEGLDRASAERLVQHRMRQPFTNLGDVQPLLPTGVTPNTKQVGVFSTLYEVRGQLRYEGYVLRQLSLVQRRQTDVTVLRSERLAGDEPDAPR